MDCNKEEAIRTKELAEIKMQKNDFAGARKLGLKAQQLHPNTDNIIQLLTVCDVHCASQQKINGYEMDWYGILQIGQTADDSLIKKQYRKLALLLHPDKNQFPGAEAAFKIIGEAQRLLSDPVKRQMHDMKRRINVRPPVVRVPSQQTKNQYTGRQSVPNGYKGPFVPQYANVNLRQQPQSPTQPAFAFSTFVTVCPFCSTMHHVHVLERYRSVLCLFCKKSFIASEVSSEKLAGEKNDRKAAFVQKDIPSQGQPNTSMKFEGNVHSKNLHMNGSTEATRSKVDAKNGVGIESTKSDNKRNRTKLEETSESIDSDSSSGTDEQEIFAADGKLGKDCTKGTDGDRNCRRSRRQRKKISYNESLSDDELLSHNDNGAEVDSAPERENQGVKLRSVENKSDHKGFESPSNISSNGCIKTQKLKRREFPDWDNNGSPISAPKQSSYTCTDPQCNSFDGIRKEECFKVGQIWALYDDVGAMPRCYGRVKNIYWSNKKLLLNWLDRDSDDEVAHKWANRRLPYSCGKYSSGRTQIMYMDRGRFSHQVIWEKGSENTIYIYPRKGQTWALFKNWNINKASESMSAKTYEYELVEVLSDYAEGYGVTVSYVSKAKGYVSIFCRMDSDQKSFCIPPGEMVRFSHMIPSFQLTGEEREGVSRGFFELDPASVPINLEAVVDLKDLTMFPGRFKPTAESIIGVASSRCSRDNCSGVGSQDNYSGKQSGDPKLPTSSSRPIEVPDPEFFDFESNRSYGKFKIGQIWAVYSDDELPKYYVQIQSIRSSPKFELVTKWLNSHRVQGNMVTWHDKKMPLGCGFFKLSRGKPREFCPITFSHILNPQTTGRKGEFVIFPKNGEVWALYKDWDPEMSYSDIEDFKYDIAEVVKVDEQTVEVLLLHHVSGHSTVFRGDANGITLRIPKNELLRFSHQIPSFRLTDELDGSLRGYWELDSAAVPPSLLCTG